jgi:tetratricopeptide (TPR) repeat protein
MPASKSTDIVHVAATDHRILKIPESQASARLSPAEVDTPLRLVNGDHSGTGDSESLGREMGIALTFEAGTYTNIQLGKQINLRALHLLDRALAERPDDFEVKRLRARALALAGRRREAVDLQREILKIAPSYEQVLEEFIQYTIELRDPRPALAPAAQAVALNPGSSDLRERLAYLLCQVKDWNGALRESRESLRLNPFRRFARMFLIESLLHRNDAAGAEVEAAKLFRLHPDERSALEQWYAEKRKSQGR